MSDPVTAAVGGMRIARQIAFVQKWADTDIAISVNDRLKSDYSCVCGTDDLNPGTHIQFNRLLGGGGEHYVGPRRSINPLSRPYPLLTFFKSLSYTSHNLREINT